MPKVWSYNKNKIGYIMTTKELENLVKDWISERPDERAGMLVLSDMDASPEEQSMLIEGDPHHAFIPIYRALTERPEIANKLGEMLKAILICISMPFQMQKKHGKGQQTE